MVQYGKSLAAKREGKKKKTKLVRKREAGWETHVDFGLRPGESNGVRKESALATWSEWTDAMLPGWLREWVDWLIGRRTDRLTD